MSPDTKPSVTSLGEATWGVNSGCRLTFGVVGSGGLVLVARGQEAGFGEAQPFACISGKKTPDTISAKISLEVCRLRPLSLVLFARELGDGERLGVGRELGKFGGGVGAAAGPGGDGSGGAGAGAAAGDRQCCGWRWSMPGRI
jgi:hypothetical protein